MNFRFLITPALVGAIILAGLGSINVVQAAVIPQSYKFMESEIILNDKVVVAKAAHFVANGTSYLSLYDAELLVNKITNNTNMTGLVNGKAVNWKTGTADVWNGTKKAWNIEFTHGIPSSIKNSHGTATFYLNNREVLHAPIILAKPNGFPQMTTFLPIWYVQQVINQLIISTQTHSDTWDGATTPAKWVVSYSSTFGATYGGSMHPVTVVQGTGSAPVYSETN